jgi:hypothetical protein
MKTARPTLVALTASAMLVASLASCTNFRTREENAAATGGLIGAGAGAVLSDDPLKGAAVGGALGAGAGYLLERSRHNRRHHRHY